MHNPLLAEGFFIRDVREGKTADALKWLECPALNPPLQTQRDFVIFDAIRWTTRHNEAEPLRTLIRVAKKEKLGWDFMDLGHEKGEVYAPLLTDRAARFGADKAAKVLVEEGAQLSPRSLSILIDHTPKPDERHKRIAQLYLDSGVNTKEKSVITSSGNALLLFTPLAFLDAFTGFLSDKPDTSIYDYARKLPDNPIAKIVVDHVRKAIAPPPSLADFSAARELCQHPNHRSLDQVVSF